MIFNSRDIFHKEPFGASEAGREIRFRLRLPQGSAEPALELFSDNAESFVCAIPMTRQGASGGEELFSCVFLPSAPGRYLYRFCVGGALLHNIGRGEAGYGGGTLWQQIVYDATFSTPRELAGCVFYQIFPDRFCASGSAKSGVPQDRYIHESWDEAPKDAPDADGEFRCNDYFGGDLAGIEEKLDYLRDMGVEALYLNPIFEAHSNHRYNTADYERIDPLLGSEEDFTRLCASAAARGIRIILDGVFNHTGSDSRYFNREKRYGEGGAYNDTNSIYRDWFNWENNRLGYASWWGFGTLPELNEANPDFRSYICGRDGILRRWLRRGASGWRLDVADELSDSFICEIRAAVKAQGEDKLLLGEVWEDASEKFSGGEQRRFLMGRELDSVMNYPWRGAIIGFVRSGGGEMLEEAIASLLENYPPQSISALLNVLSTHDIPRAITALAAPPQGTHDRDWQRANNTLSPEQYYRGRQLFMLASVIQFTLPGCPCVYYGDEAGLVGYSDPFNRGTYPWGREDAGLRDCIALLGRLRRDSATLRRGSYRAVRFDENICAYLRERDGERLLICVNRGECPAPIPWEAQELAAARRLLTIGSVQPDGSLAWQSAVILRLPEREENRQ